MGVSPGRGFFVTLFVFILPLLVETASHVVRHYSDRALRTWYKGQLVVLAVWSIVALFGMAGAYGIQVRGHARLIVISGLVGFLRGHAFDFYWLYGIEYISVLVALAGSWMIRPKKLTVPNKSGKNVSRGGGGS
ncbi:hypothetical protein [Sulfobacillus harzensis]|uniref:Uncharacterized protein n=1 Tax=Sulfobacillus harzensis TaxID=2729629 RepID=A0A7Y0L500_9FIRM|nr:hypothetical protein [Sulfobacillus harzensis]NMP23427.1 hypothetical protein [Sulfobacillus harzensis]